MDIATSLDAAPVTAWPNPLALQHHDPLKQEIKTLLDVGIIYKSMSPWETPL